MFLNKKDFSFLVKNGPIISIDLCIIQNKSILLGKRTNPPAKNYLFVPGGRIYKNETIPIALERIIKTELGIFSIDLIKKEFLGVFEHFYQDNFLDNANFNSHYVVLAYVIFLNSYEPKLKEQHSEYLWYNKNIKNIDYVEKNIHQYSKDYITNSKVSFLIN